MISDVSKGVKTRFQTQNECSYLVFLSQIESKHIDDALEDELWLLAMHDELDDFDRNNIEELVSRPQNCSIIGTKWVLCNKLDEHDIDTTYNKQS